MLALLPMLLMVRLFRPVVVFRFGPLSTSRIGHFAADTEVYLCEREAGLLGRRTLDIFYHGSPVSNRQLKKMWDRRLRVSALANRLDQLNKWLPRGEAHRIPWRSNQDRDVHGLLDRTQPHLEFTSQEERWGVEQLEQMGIGPDTPFVCFHSRDSAYLDTVLQPPLSDSWRRHDYRDSDVQNYLPAAEELARRGYFAVRVGAVVKKPLETTNPAIIDYTSMHRTDFLDIYLGAKCTFYVGSGDGLAAIPMVFRRPIVWINYVPFEFAHTWSSQELFIPKKYWLHDEQRFMSFREILESGVGRFTRAYQYDDAGIDLVENTPQEISAAVMEMDGRVKNAWHTTGEDEDLQQQFWSLFDISDLNREFRSRIGADFLRENRHWLA